MLLERIFAQGQRIFDARPDLHQRFADPAGLDYWVWLMSDGLHHYPDLAALVPIPPPELMGNAAHEGPSGWQDYIVLRRR